MNIFYLSSDTEECAQQHCDKHVVKMIVEYAQLMSTAHRVLDGVLYLSKTKAGRKINRWRLDDNREQLLYKASHINHPSGLWVRKTNNNYNWLYSLFCELNKEYSYRYSKDHKTFSDLSQVLKVPPNNIPIGYFTPPPPAMPDQYKISTDSIQCYKQYYRGAKIAFAKWTGRHRPEWFVAL